MYPNVSVTNEDLNDTLLSQICKTESAQTREAWSSGTSRSGKPRTPQKPKLSHAAQSKTVGNNPTAQTTAYQRFTKSGFHVKLSEKGKWSQATVTFTAEQNHINEIDKAGIPMSAPQSLCWVSASLLFQPCLRRIRFINRSWAKNQDKSDFRNTSTTMTTHSWWVVNTTQKCPDSHPQG